MVVCSLGWLLGLRAPVPARGPQAEKERREKEGNGDARSSRESQEIQGRKPGGSATDGRCIYIRGPVPGKGRPERKQRENGAGRLVVCSLGWLFGLAGPGPRQRVPSREGEKGKGRQRGRRKQQRERQGIQGRKPGGSATDGRCIYIRGPVPGKGRPEEEAEREWSRTVGCL